MSTLLPLALALSISSPALPSQALSSEHHGLCPERAVVYVQHRSLARAQELVDDLGQRGAVFGADVAQLLASGPWGAVQGDLLDRQRPLAFALTLVAGGEPTLTAILPFEDGDAFRPDPGVSAVRAGDYWALDSAPGLERGETAPALTVGLPADDLVLRADLASVIRENRFLVGFGLGMMEQTMVQNLTAEGELPPGVDVDAFVEGQMANVRNFLDSAADLIVRARLREEELALDFELGLLAGSPLSESLDLPPVNLEQAMGWLDPEACAWAVMGDDWPRAFERSFWAFDTLQSDPSAEAAFVRRILVPLRELYGELGSCVTVNLTSSAGSPCVSLFTAPTDPMGLAERFAELVGEAAAASAVSERETEFFEGVTVTCYRLSELDPALLGGESSAQDAELDEQVIELRAFHTGNASVLLYGGDAAALRKAIALARGASGPAPQVSSLLENVGGGGSVQLAHLRLGPLLRQFDAGLGSAGVEGSLALYGAADSKRLRGGLRIDLALLAQLASQKREPLVDRAADSYPSSFEEAVEEGLARRLGTPIRRHAGGVSTAAFSADGRLALTAGWSGVLSVWDTSRGTEIGSIDPLGLFEEASIHRAAFVDGGRRILAIAVDGRDDEDVDGSLLEIDVESLELVRELELDRLLGVAAFAADGSFLVGGEYGGSEVIEVDLADGSQRSLVQDLPGELTALALSRDGKALALGGEAPPFLHLVERASGELLSELDVRSPLIGLAFDPGAEWLAASCGDESKVWSLESSEVLQRIAAEDLSLDLVVGAEGPTFYFASPSEEVWGFDLESTQPVFESRVDGTAVALAVAPGGKLLLTCDEAWGVSFWDTAGKREVLVSEGHPRAVTAIDYAPDGELIASAAGDGSVILWDPRQARPVREIRTGLEDLMGLVWAADGQRMQGLAADRASGVWDRAGNATGSGSARASSVDLALFCVSRDRSLYAIYDYDSGALVVRSASGGVENYRYSISAPEAQDAAFSPSGRRLAIAGVEGSLRILDLERKVEESRTSLAQDDLTAVAFAQEEVLALGVADGNLAFVEIASLEPRLVQRLEPVPEEGEEAWIGPLAVSGDGRWLLVSSYWGLVFYDCASLEEVASLPAPDVWVEALAFAPDSSTFATGLDDGTILIWNLEAVLALRD